MKVLFIISSSDTAFWLSEVTHPYWHLVERGVEVDFASPQGGKVVYDPYSDPYFEHSTEAEDLVSKGKYRVPGGACLGEGVRGLPVRCARWSRCASG